MTQTAKTVTVIEDGQEKRSEEVVKQLSLPTTSPTGVTSRGVTAKPANFSPVFIYKNHRFTSDAPKPVVNVESSVTTSEGEVVKAVTNVKSLAVQTTAKPATTSIRPRRKVIKVKSRKTKKDSRPVKDAKEFKDDRQENVTTVVVPKKQTELKATTKAEVLKATTPVKEAKNVQERRPGLANRRPSMR